MKKKKQNGKKNRMENKYNQFWLFVKNIIKPFMIASLSMKLK